jgi:hypothetical protein
MHLEDGGPENTNYRWRHARCPHCGQRYRDFRAPGQLTFKDARVQIRSERDRRIEEDNDYSKPPRRARVLWAMHEYKLMWWEMVHSQCEEHDDGS